ncbi:MAG: hypothetical protein HOO86_05965 [Bacteroidales bacterium]|nr:hypothetical protein [Bacteroidales bacterium]
MEKHYSFQKSMLILIATGVWVVVLQLSGIIPQIRPMQFSSQDVLQVKGIVEVENVVLIKGTVDANLESINGYSKFYKDPRTGEFYVLPVTDPYQ